MGRYAVLEQGEGLSRTLWAWFGAPVQPTDRPELLVVSPRSAGTVPMEVLHCGTVLLPGDAGRLLGRICARNAVSYGLSGRDTITLSSRREGRLWVAVQRELVCVDGTVLERQEVAIGTCGDANVPRMLALAGAGLLMGVSPQELERQCR